jgi:hypothetical protein
MEAVINLMSNWEAWAVWLILMGSTLIATNYFLNKAKED